MVCPKCLVQMHQSGEVGGGKADEREYVTWELKKCPACGREVFEYYRATEATSVKEKVALMTEYGNECL